MTSKKTTKWVLDYVLDLENKIYVPNPSTADRDIEGDNVWRIYDVIETGYETNPYWFE